MSSHSEMRKELKIKPLNQRKKELKTEYLASLISNKKLINELYTTHNQFRIFLLFQNSQSKAAFEA